MQSELKGSPVKIYKLHREAAPMGGLIAMKGNNPVATCIKEGDEWTLRTGEEGIVTTFEGNTSGAALALHAYLMGFAKAVQRMHAEKRLDDPTASDANADVWFMGRQE